MLTRWGRDINAHGVLDEYPRPQLTREIWQNLNGPWQYSITPKSAPQPTRWEGEILVPFCIESSLSGISQPLTPGDRLWYRRTISLGQTNLVSLLHFGAVDYECAVWINGAFVGSHTGGFDAFTLNITEYVSTGENELIVGVTDPTSRGQQPRGKQHLNPQGIWYTPVSGIWQTVWLEQVPEQHITELSIETAQERDGVVVKAHLNRPSRDPKLAIRIRISLGGRSISDTMARPDRRVRIPIPEPHLWTPDSPTLYDVSVSLLRIENPMPSDADGSPEQLERGVPQHGQTEGEIYRTASAGGSDLLDEVGSYFGLRSIELGPHPQHGHPVLLLNDQPLFHLGTLDQGWWPDGLLTPPSDAGIIHEIEFLKSAGFNTLRKHIKVEPARYYYHCDRLGMLVWQDMPSGFLPAQFVAPNDEGESIRSSRSEEGFELELQRMINNLSHHPCVVVWVLHNEGWGQFDTYRLTERIRQLDPTRIVNASSGWLDVGAGDMIDRHDYQSLPSAPTGDGQRASVIGEYGGLGWPLVGHLWNPDMRNWGYQTVHTEQEARSCYASFTQAIVDARDQQGLCAAIYTQTTDVEGEVNGLMTYDREAEKFPREWLAELHSPLTRLDP